MKTIVINDYLCNLSVVRNILREQPSLIPVKPALQTGRWKVANRTFSPGERGIQNIPKIPQQSMQSIFVTLLTFFAAILASTTTKAEDVVEIPDLDITIAVPNEFTVSKPIQNWEEGYAVAKLERKGMNERRSIEITAKLCDAKDISETENEFIDLSKKTFSLAGFTGSEDTLTHGEFRWKVISAEDGGEKRALVAAAVTRGNNFVLVCLLTETFAESQKATDLPKFLSGIKRKSAP